MGLRRFIRGRVSWQRLESVFRSFGERYNQPALRVAFLEADNWLSIPCAVNDRWFVKIISPQNSLVHGLFTGARNLGAFSAGTEGFFEHLDTPLDMAEHDLEATRRMRALGVNAPEPIEAFEVDGLGVLVMEFLPDFATLEDLDSTAVRPLAPDVFDALSTMHTGGLVHGDLRGENVLVVDAEIYFIDATNVRNDGVGPARAYDLACGLAVLTPAIGSRETVEIAADYYSIDQLLDAREFLDFVNIRPDHDFDAAGIKGEIDKRAR